MDQRTLNDIVRDEARRVSEARKRVIISLTEPVEMRYNRKGQRTFIISGKEGDRTSALCAVFEEPELQSASPLHLEQLEREMLSIDVGAKLSLAGSWTKCKWEQNGVPKESWEFRATRYGYGDVPISSMNERQAAIMASVSGELAPPEFTMSAPAISAVADQSIAAVEVDAVLMGKVRNALSLSRNDTYAGIGSRETPPDVMRDMTLIASAIEARGGILRSGGADGADSAFSNGVLSSAGRQVFIPWSGFNGVTDGVLLNKEAVPAAMEIAAKYHPKWHLCSPGAKSLHARNVAQVLGEDLKSPSRFVLGWTADGKASGGTGQAMRIADGEGVKVFNLHDKAVRAAFMSELGIGPKVIEIGSQQQVASLALVQKRVLKADVNQGSFDLMTPEVTRFKSDEVASFSKVREANGKLSNMCNETPFLVGGVRWGSSEAFYQALRFPDRPDVQEYVRGAGHAYEAKTRAYEYKAETRSDWEQVKEVAMAFTVTRRLEAPAFVEALNETGTKRIVELSTRDPFWGAQPHGNELVGRDALGNILTQLREGARLDTPPLGSSFPGMAAFLAEQSGKSVDSPSKDQSVSRERGNWSYTQGDVSADKAEVVVNTVNCVGAMGKGVALSFKERYPSMMPEYREAIRSGALQPGGCVLIELPTGQKMAALATKDDWRDKSKPEWIESGLKALADEMRKAGLKTVALPPPGCGNGGLDWRDVEPVVARTLAEFDVSVYAKPSGADLGFEQRRVEAAPKDITLARDLVADPKQTAKSLAMAALMNGRGV